MKTKQLFIISALLYSINAISQQTPTPSPPADPAVPLPLPLPQQGTVAWYRGGNTPSTAGANKNIFGTLWNSPIYTVTNGALRMKLNATFNIAGAPQYTINGFTAANGVNTSGYLWIGPDAPIGGGGTYYNNKGAFSMLHLNGTTTLAAIELGYRPWMKTGITFTENSDLMYVGRKSSGTSPATADQTDAVISWSDDGAGPPFFGPDNMRFIFTFGNAAGTSAPNGDLTGGGMDGREIMRMTPQGNIGVGPRFNNSNQPTSTYHQHQENSLSSWMQITNQRMTAAATNTTPTAINPTNGFRFGILGSANLPENGNAFIFNQEKRHIIFSTGFATPGSMANSFERMRITAIENPTTLASGTFGIYNPAGLPTDRTRVAISHGPTQPITRPLSLLHLGYNTGLVSATPGATDGWRPWMDIGTFTTNGTDNIYVGLKQEGTSSDQSDAVINWGDNQSNSFPPPFPPNGPDNLRFIFTATQTGTGGTPPATGNDGLEVARMAPNGNMGIGNFYNNPFAAFTRTPANRLEILTDKTSANSNGNPQLRLTNFQQDPANIATTGKYSEFHETAIGDLGILSYDNTLSGTNTTDQFFSERFVGINTINPGNTLEINSQLATHTTANNQTALPSPNPAPTGWAGLRFSDLRSTSAPQANPGKGVLAVNANGDVIYVPSNGGYYFGGVCGTSPAPLNSGWEIPLPNVP